MNWKDEAIDLFATLTTATYRPSGIMWMPVKVLQAMAG
jgi:hypothetical protein